MNDTLWILLLVALTGLGARLAKLWPKLPKKLMPILAMAIGAGLYVLKATLVDGAAAAEALLSWQVILTGASAIVGHDLLKGALQCAGLSDQLIASVLGSLPKEPPKEPPATPPPSTIFVGIVVALSVLLVGCGAGVQAQVADAMAKGVNHAKADLLVIYEQEGDAAIPAPDRETSDAQIAAVDERWEPVWDSIEAFAIVHDQWATAIETGGAVDIEKVLAAFCKLVGLAKPWFELPGIPGVVCPVVSP